MTPEQCHRTRCSSFIIKFEKIPHTVLHTYESDTSDVVLFVSLLILNTFSVLV